MKLTGAGTAFELRIVGYEFPEIIGEKYDSNWLLIEGHVTLMRFINLHEWGRKSFEVNQTIQLISSGWIQSNHYRPW